MSLVSWVRSLKWVSRGSAGWRARTLAAERRIVTRRPWWRPGLERLEDRLAPASGNALNPVVAVASYLGSNGNDSVAGIGVDSYGFIYVAGSTTSAIQSSGRRDGFGGTPGNVVGPGGGQDVFVAKLDRAGTNIQWLTFLGGSLSDTATAFVVGSGWVYVAGYTYSPDYPEAFHVYGGHPHGFVTALSQTDGSVFYSTPVGGDQSDFVNSLAVDAQGRAYVAGSTSSSFLAGYNPTFLDPYGLHPNGGSFVATLDGSGNLTQASIFDYGQGYTTAIAQDGNGHLYLTGSTRSDTFPTTLDAYQSARHASNFPSTTDAFVTRLRTTDLALDYSTYLGGSGDDVGNAITVDSTGVVTVAGTTNSADFPNLVNGSTGPTPFHGGSAHDGFVARLDPRQAGAGALIYSLCLGGTNDDAATALAQDADGNVYVTGYTFSPDFPVQQPIQLYRGNTLLAGSFGGDNAFLTRVSPAGAIDFSTYLGQDNAAYAVAVGPLGDDSNLYVAGFAGLGFQSSNAATLGGRFDAGISDVDGFFMHLETHSGLFATPVSVAVSSHPTAVAVADFDQDRKDDLAVANEDTGTVTILQSGNIRATSFNSDGSPYAWSLDGGADGLFPLQYQVDVSTRFPRTTVHPQSLVAGDFNGDGLPDLAVAYSAGGGYVTNVAVLLGNGGGSFRLAQDFTLPAGNFTVGVNPLVVADFNNDGKDDLAINAASIQYTFSLTGQTVRSQSVLLYLGGTSGLTYQGSFSPEQDFASIDESAGAGILANPTGPAAETMTAGAFNGARVLAVAYKRVPGYIDYLAGNFVQTDVTQYGVKILQYDPSSGTLVDQGSYLSHIRVTSLAAVDLNHDGQDDLLLASGAEVDSGGNVITAPGYTGFYYLPATGGQGPPTFGGGYGDLFYLPIDTMQVADLNNDGIPDLVSSAGSYLGTFLATDGGRYHVNFSNPKLFPDPDPNGSAGFTAGGTGAVVGDFNGDGSIDVAAPGWPDLLVGGTPFPGSNVVYVFPNGHLLPTPYLTEPGNDSANLLQVFASTPSQPLTLHVSVADPLAAAWDLPFTYTVDWGDGTQTTLPANVQELSHTYTHTGNFRVTVAATDGFGQSSAHVDFFPNKVFNPALALIEVDPAVQSGNTLAVGAGAGPNTITLSKGSVIVSINGQAVGEYDVTGPVTVYGQDSTNTTVTVDPQLTNPLTVYGGSGTNTLQGGGGSNVLVGGSGSNTFLAGPGSNLIIPGPGSNTFVDGGGQNTFQLAAGATTPAVFNDQYATVENTTLDVAGPGVLGNDLSADGNPLTAVLVGGPAHGTLTLQADGSFRYVLDDRYVGTDAFTYEARGSDGSLSSAATVTLRVDQAPAATFDVTLAPSGHSSQPQTVTVTARNVLGEIATGYRGTIHFSSSDPAAHLPADYLFTAADAGSHTFVADVIPIAAGSQTVAATDTGNDQLRGTATIFISPRAVSWIGAAGDGDWDTPGNWSTGTVPTRGDAVTIDAPGATITHAAAAADGVYSLTDNAALVLSAGSLAVFAPSSIGSSLTLAGATLNGPGDVTVSGPVTCTSAALSGTGSLTANGGLSVSGTLTLDGYTLTNPAGQTATWSANLQAVHGARLENYGTLDNRADVLFGGDQTAGFDNYGSFVKSGGDPTFQGPATGTPGVRAFNHFTAFTIPFSSSGSVEAQVGELLLGGNTQVTISGPVVGRAGTQLALEGGTNVFTATSSIDADDMIFYFADATVAGHYRANRTAVQYDTVVFTATSTVAGLGDFTIIQGGTIDLAAATFTTGVTTLPDLYLNGTLRRAGNFVVTGGFTWAGGTLDAAGGTGSLTAQTGMTVSGGVTLDAYTLTNPAGRTATWSANLVAVHGARLENYGTLDDRADVQFGGDPTAAFDNFGTFIKSGGDTSFQDYELGVHGLHAFNHFTAFTIPFSSSGSVEAQVGELLLGGNTQVTVSGAVVGRPGTQLALEGGTNLFTATSSISADDFQFYFADATIAGSYLANRTSVVDNTVVFTATSAVGGLGDLTVIWGGTVDLTAATLAPDVTTLPSLYLAGVLRRADDFVVTCAFTWTGGDLDAAGGRGSLTAESGMSLGSSLLLDNYTLVNAAGQVATLTRDLTLVNGAIFDNEGTLAVGSSSSLFRGHGDPSAVHLFNHGSITKTGPGDAGLLLPIDSDGSITVLGGDLGLGDYFGSEVSHYTGTLSGAVGTVLEFDGSADCAGVTISTLGMLLNYSGTSTFDAASSIDAHSARFLGLTMVAGSYRSDSTAAGAPMQFTGTVHHLGALALSSLFDLTAATLDPSATTLDSLDLGGPLRGAYAFIVTGQFSADGGSLDAAGGTGSLVALGGMTFAGIDQLDGYALTNASGQTADLEGLLHLFNSSVFVNEGALAVGSHGNLHRGGGDTSAVHLFNYGSIVKTGPGDGGLLVPIDSDGPITVLGGDLGLGDYFGSEVSHYTGTLSGAVGTILEFDGSADCAGVTFSTLGMLLNYSGRSTFDAASSIDAHSARFLGPTTVAGSYRTDSTAAGAPIQFTGVVHHLGALALSSLFDLTAATLDPSATTLDSLDLGGTLRGAYAFTVTGPFSSSGGSLDAAGGSGSLVALGGMTLAGIGQLDGYALTNAAGQTADLEGFLQLFNGSVFDNEGTLLVGSSGNLHRGGGDTSAVHLFNHGSITKTGPGDGGLLVPIDSDGPITVLGGDLGLGDYFGSEVSHYTGTLSGAADTTLEFDGSADCAAVTVSTLGTLMNYAGTSTFDAASSIDAHSAIFRGPTTVAGSYRTDSTGAYGPVWLTGRVQRLGALSVGYLLDLTAATLDPAATTLDSLDLGGTLRGAYAFTVTGPFNSNGGSLDAAGDTGSLVALGGMTLAGIGQLDGYSLTNAAGQTADLEGLVHLVNGSVFDNEGTLAVGSHGYLQRASGDTTAVHLINRGSITKTGPRDGGALVPIDSDGSITVLGGDLGLGDYFGTAVSHFTGTLSGAAGTILEFDGSAACAAVTISTLGTLIDYASTSTFDATSGIDAHSAIFSGPTTVAGSYRTDSTGAYGPVWLTGRVQRLGNLAVGSLLDLTAATLDPAATTLDSLNLGGTLRGAYAFTVTGSFSGNGGRLDAAGGSGSLTALGGMMLAGIGQLDGYSLTNPVGQTANLASTLFLANGAVFDNEGTLALGSTGFLRRTIGDTSAVQFLNRGSVTKTGVGEGGLMLPISGDGPIALLQGSLDLGDHWFHTDCTYGGPVTGAPGTLFYLTGGGGTGTFLDDFDVDRVIFADASPYLFAGSYRSNFSQMNGTVSVTGPVLGIADLSINGGSVDFSPAVGGPVTLTFNSLTLDSGTLTGTDEHFVTGHFSWNNATLASADGAGTLSATAGMDLTGNLTLSGYTLTNAAGQTANLAYVLYLASGAVFDNEGTLALGSTGFLRRTIGDTSALQFLNRGGVTKTGVGEGGLMLPISGDGPIALQQGSLDLGDHWFHTDCTYGGPVTGAAGTLFYLTGGGGTGNFFGDFEVDRVIFSDGSPYLFAGSYRSGSTLINGTVSITGPVLGIADLEVHGGSVDFSPAVGGPVTLTFSSLTLDSGTLTGTDEHFVTGHFSWNNATLASADGAGTLSATAGMDLTGNLTLSGYTLTNAAGQTANLAYVLYLASGAVFDSEGTLALGSTGFLRRTIGDTSAVQFLNRGGVTKTGVGEGGLMLPISGDGPIALLQGSLDLGDHWYHTDCTYGGPVTGAPGTLIFLTGGGGTGTFLDDIDVDRVIFADGSPYLFAGSYRSGTTQMNGRVSITGPVLGIGDLTVQGSVDFRHAVGGPATITVNSLTLNGTLTGTDRFQVLGDYRQTNAGALDLTLASLADLVQVGGNVTLAGGLQLARAPDFAANLGDQVTLLRNQGTAAAAGTFAGLPDGSTVAVGGYRFRLSYHGGTGNDVALTVVDVPNHPPTASAGGPYTINEGEALALNAAASTDPDGDPLTYSWDINADGVFGDAVGVNPTLSWTDLNALGLGDGGTFDVRVRVDDGHGHVVDSSPALLTVNEAPPTAVHIVNAGITSAGTVSFTVQAFGPNLLDEAAGYTFTVHWNDGTPTTTLPASPFNGTGGLAVPAHTYAPGLWTPTVTAAEDGGQSQTATALVVVSATAGDSITVSGGAGQVAVATASEGSLTTTAIPDQVLVAGNGGNVNYTVNFGDTLTTPITLAGGGAAGGDTVVANGAGGTTDAINKTSGQITWGVGATDTVLYAGIPNVTISANGTVSNYVNDPGGNTTINGGPGANTIVITATTSAGVVINGGGTTNTYIIDLGNLAGPVTINNHNTAAVNNLVVNGAPGDSAITAAGTQITAGGQIINVSTPLAGATINGGSGNTQFTVANFTVPVANLDLQGGAGNNTFTLVNVGATVGTLELVGSPTGTNQVQVQGSLPPVVLPQHLTPVVMVTAPTVAYGLDGLVTVTVGAGGLAAAGNVTLTVDATTYTHALSGGAWTFDAGLLPLGTHHLSAVFPAQGNFAGSSGTGTLTVDLHSSLYVLNPTAAGALSLAGNASVRVGGVVEVNSSAANALAAGGTAQLSAGALRVLGGVQPTGSASVAPAAVVHAALPDPLANLPAPDAAGLTAREAVNLAGTSALTICPGIYSSIKVSGSATLTLQPGVYVLAGGGLAVTGNGNIRGDGVLFYNAGNNFPASGGSFGGLTLTGTGTVRLTPMTAGTYARILIFQARDNPRALSLGGNGGGLQGVIYAPQALVAVSGNAQLQASLVVSMLQFSGTTGSTLTAAGDGAGGSNTAGQLLAGDLVVYVDNSAGNVTADEQARIDGAIDAVNLVVSAYGVAVTQVSAADRAWATTVLRLATGSPSGCAAEGVLGSEYDGGITLVQGWNWYTGADGRAVGAGQYDFESIVIHELGHALGLGHSADPTSAMYATLATGQARRALTVADLAIPDVCAGPCGLHVATVAPAARPAALPTAAVFPASHPGVALTPELAAFAFAGTIGDDPPTLVGGNGDGLVLGEPGRDCLVGGFADQAAGKAAEPLATLSASADAWSDHFAEVFASDLDAGGEF
jgi:hypothetical protein